MEEVLLTAEQLRELLNRYRSLPEPKDMIKRIERIYKIERLEKLLAQKEQEEKQRASP